MIEMKVFDDVNKIYPVEVMTLYSNSPNDQLSPGDRQGWSKLKKFFKFKRSVYTYFIPYSGKFSLSFIFVIFVMESPKMKN